MTFKDRGPYNPEFQKRDEGLFPEETRRKISVAVISTTIFVFFLLGFLLMAETSVYPMEWCDAHLRSWPFEDEWRRLIERKRISKIFYCNITVLYSWVFFGFSILTILGVFVRFFEKILFYKINSKDKYIVKIAYTFLFIVICFICIVSPNYTRRYYYMYFPNLIALPIMLGNFYFAWRRPKQGV